MITAISTWKRAHGDWKTWITCLLPNGISLQATLYNLIVDCRFSSPAAACHIWSMLHFLSVHVGSSLSVTHLLLCVKRACYMWQPSYVIVACTLFFVCALALHVSCFTVVTGTNYLPSGYKFDESVKYSCTVWLILWLNGTYVSSSSILSQALLEYKHQLAWLSILLLPSSSFV